MWRREVDGFIVESGQAAQKEDMASDKVRHLRRNMREPGQLAFKMDTALRPMQTVVSGFKFFIAYRYT